MLKTQTQIILLHEHNTFNYDATSSGVYDYLIVLTGAQATVIQSSGSLR
jgi:hypothetical protein